MDLECVEIGDRVDYNVLLQEDLGWCGALGEEDEGED